MALACQYSYWTVRRLAKDDPRIKRYGFVTSARDLARFGFLILSEGRWKETEVIQNSGYLRGMTQSSKKLNSSYGYLWWINGQSEILRGARALRSGPLIPGAPEDLVGGFGALGRKVYIAPSQHLVVTRLGDAPRAKFDEQFWKRLMAAAPK